MRESIAQKMKQQHQAAAAAIEVVVELVDDVGLVIADTYYLPSDSESIVGTCTASAAVTQALIIWIVACEHSIANPDTIPIASKCKTRAAVVRVRQGYRQTVVQ